MTGHPSSYPNTAEALLSREEVSAEDRRIMGSPDTAKLDLIERTREWRLLRQPIMSNRAALNDIDVKEREARFQLANAAALWLWHEENPTPQPPVPAQKPTASAELSREPDATVEEIQRLILIEFNRQIPESRRAAERVWNLINARAKTLARQATTSVLPLREGQAEECDGGLRSGVRTMVAEIAFDPTNHHNALLCPYCNPNGLKFESADTTQPAAPSTASTAWLPIETAPKDGTKVDLLFTYPRGRQNDCQWRQGAVYGDGGWFWSIPQWGSQPGLGIDWHLLPEDQWETGCYPNMEPTHWMRPPAPPDDIADTTQSVMSTQRDGGEQ